MGLQDDLRANVSSTFSSRWDVRDGVVVPDPEDLKHDNDAVRFERATVLYADLDGSTNLVDTKKWYFAAEIYKTYLYCAARLINNAGGDIVSYDGDRVMGIFISKTQSTDAVECAMKISWAVSNIINPSIKNHYNTDYEVKQKIGIDTSEIRAARTGVRGGNDLVWVGRAANYAAKLTAISQSPPIFITDAVFNKMMDSVKYGGANNDFMWKKWKWTEMNDYPIHSTTWNWRI